jgi:hypothetical protein
LVHIIESLDRRDLNSTIEPLQRCLAKLQAIQNLLEQPLVDEISTLDPTEFEVEFGAAGAMAAIEEL